MIDVSELESFARKCEAMQADLKLVWYKKS